MQSLLPVGSGWHQLPAGRLPGKGEQQRKRWAMASCHCMEKSRGGGGGGVTLLPHSVTEATGM